MSLEQKLKDPSAYKGKVSSLLGEKPKTSLKGEGYLSINDSFSKGTYQDYVLDTDAAGSTTDDTSYKP